MKQTVLQAIIAFVFGHKYYVNIFNRRGTPMCEISSFIFSTKEEADAHLQSMETSVAFQHVETVTLPFSLNTTAGEGAMKFPIIAGCQTRQNLGGR